VECGDDDTAVEPAKPHRSKREKRLERRDRRRTEGTANRKGYGKTPEEAAAKKERIAIQKKNIELKKMLQEQGGAGPSHRTKWQVVGAEEGSDGSPQAQGEVLLFYKYVDVPDAAAECQRQATLCGQLALHGRVRVASEGINGTLGGTQEGITAYKAAMDADEVFQGIQWKSAPGGAYVFSELRVRLCEEIVSLGVAPTEVSFHDAAEHLTPQDFHARITANEGPKPRVVLDVRNEYEHRIGRFEDALCLPIRQFSDFPKHIEESLPTLRDSEVYMYCTGGIRCERASAYLRSKGVNEVYQLEDGIHRYLETFPAGAAFRGKNFVFDNRIAVPSEDKEVIAACEFCDVPYDSFADDRRCRHCRSLVLACPGCQVHLGGSYACLLCCQNASSNVEFT